MQITTPEEMCELMCGNAEEYEYCLRCGRKLKNPDARILGYGKTCFEKLQKSDKTKALF